MASRLIRAPMAGDLDQVAVGIGVGDEGQVEAPGAPT
jgi:hypothetical protein